LPWSKYLRQFKRCWADFYERQNISILRFDINQTITREKMGKNWNSKKQEYSPVVREETKQLAGEVKSLIDQGYSRAEAAKKVNKSVSRIRELLK